MSISAVHLHVKPSELSIESLATNKNISSQQKVDEVSKQFEATLVRQILQDIRKPVLTTEQGDPTANGIYNDMINNQMADSIEKGGGLGLANSLSAQLSQQILGKSKNSDSGHSQLPRIHPISVHASTLCKP